MEFFFSFFVKDGVPQGFFCTVLCICMYKHIYTDIRVCLLEKVHAPSPLTPPPTAPYRSDSTVQKMSRQTSHRHAAARKCVYFPLTLSVFAVVLCGVRSHTTPARLPLRPVLKSDPPPPPPNVTRLMKDGRSSLRVEKKREAMSCVETEI